MLTNILNSRWSKEQAIGYLARTTGMVLRSAQDEVKRIITVPGQAVSAKFGQLKILELRHKAEEILG